MFDGGILVVVVVDGVGVGARSLRIAGMFVRNALSVVFERKWTYKLLRGWLVRYILFVWEEVMLADLGLRGRGQVWR